MVIDNRAGASGNLAMDALAKSEPDGYTLGVANTGNIVINPYLFPAMPYDPLKDLTPIGVLGTVPLFLVMNSNVPAKSLAEFIAYTKANPDKISYASAGAGTTPDLAAHEFARRAGLKFVMVPFRGTGPAVQAVLGGDVHATFVSMGPHIEFVRQGKLRVLGAATAQRPSYLPDTPTFAEQGFSGFETGTWFALFAPRGTPQPIVDQLNGYRVPCRKTRISSAGWKRLSSIPRSDRCGIRRAGEIRRGEMGAHRPREQHQVGAVRTIVSSPMALLHTALAHFIGLGSWRRPQPRCRPPCWCSWDASQAARWRKTARS